MNRQDLKNILQNAYDRNQWISTLQFLSGKRNLLSVNLSPISIDINTQEAERIVKTFNQIGTVKTSDAVSLPIYEIILEDAIKIEYNRVGVNEFIKKYIIYIYKFFCSCIVFFCITYDSNGIKYFCNQRI